MQPCIRRTQALLPSHLEAAAPPLHYLLVRAAGDGVRLLGLEASIGWSYELAFRGVTISNRECVILVENKGSNLGFIYGKWKMLPFRSEIFPPPLSLTAQGRPSSDVQAIDGRELTYSDFMRATEGIGPVGRSKWIIPHWLILLTVAALWLSLLFWRATRRRKAAAL